MLAVNRIARVPGRITFLIVSIHTIKGMRMGGVPCGTKWANICVVLLSQPKIINLNHNGSANDKVRVKCLVLVKIYGNNPIKLLIRIIIKILVNIKVIPLFFFPVRILNSLCSFSMIFNHNILLREGINQNKFGINKRKIIDLNQLSENI